MDGSDLEMVDTKVQLVEEEDGQEQQQPTKDSEASLPEKDKDKEESSEKDVNYFKTRYEIFLDYADYTTIQGLNSIFFEYQSQFGKAVWSVVVVLMLVLGTYWSFSLYLSWWNSPVMTTITTTSLPIKQVDFPTVTFCGSGIAENLLTSAIIAELYDYSRISNATPADLAYTIQWEQRIHQMTNQTQLSMNFDQYPTFLPVNGLYSTFLTSKLPNFKGNDLETLKSLARLFTSSNPDKTLLTNFRPLKMVAKGECPSGYVGDTFCYNITKPSGNKLHDLKGSQAVCSSNGSTLINFGSDLEVQRFLNLITNGNLSFPSTSGQYTFFVNASRFLGDSRVFFDIGTYSYLVASVLIENDTDTSLNCLISTQNSTPNLLTLTPTNCSAQVANIIICMLDNSRNVNFTQDVLEPLYNPEKKKNRASEITANKEKYNKLFHQFNQSYLESFFSVLWYSSLPCFDIKGITPFGGYQSAMVRYCEWNGISVPCAEVFDTFPTDIGLCCAFNMRKAEDIFLGEKYVTFIQTNQERDRSTSIQQNATDSGLKNREPKTASGRNKGLVVMLDAQSNIIFPSTFSTDFHMFMGMITPPGEFPFSAYNGFTIRPGAINEIGLTATQITADDSLRSLTPIQRNCRFPDENQGLVIYRNYSQTNCMFECALLYSYEQSGLKCTPWYYPTRDEFIAMCDPWQTVEFNRYMGNISLDKCSQCIPSCSSSKYIKKIVTVPFRNCDASNFGVSFLCNLDNIAVIPKPQLFSRLATETNLKKTIPASLANILENRQRPLDYNFVKFDSHDITSSGLYSAYPSYDAYEKDIAMVKIYFETTTVLQIGTQATSTWINYFANVGGLLGLVLGMGIISFVELVWLAMRLLAHSTRAARLIP